MFLSFFNFFIVSFDHIDLCDGNEIFYLMVEISFIGGKFGHDNF
jgi:hypothetical protein